MTGWKLSLMIPGASEADIARGIATAEAVFNEAGAIPYEAAAAFFKMLGEREDLDEREAWLTGVWQDAEAAAKKLPASPARRPKHGATPSSCCP
jgi:hypothetical protein